MKNINPTISKVYEVINIVFSVITTLFVIGFLWFGFIGAYEDKLCVDLSTCYAIVIFLAGLIVTLEIRLLDEKNWAGLILFFVEAIANLLLIPAGYITDCSGNHDGAVLMMNCVIWLDFIIVLKCLIQISIMYFKKYLNRAKKIKKKKGQDLFEYWLNKEEESDVVKRALTDKSHKQENHLLKNKETNYELATYGDSILKVCLSQILFSDGIEKPSVERSKYESDEFLVKTVASHYRLIARIHKDQKDQNMPKDYEYIKPAAKNKKSPHKYIATAVEAMIGAIYIETQDLKAIIELTNSWMRLGQSNSAGNA